MGALNHALHRTVFGRSTCSRQASCYVSWSVKPRSLNGLPWAVFRSMTRLSHMHVDVEAKYHSDEDAQLDEGLPASRGICRRKVS